MKRALAVAAGLIIGVAALPAQPVAAHGGSDADLTNDYRTRVTDVTAIEGLEAGAIGLDGTIEITWRGSGTLIVTGYEGEPYLRFDSDGVAHNLRSPATYLNQDRYATAPVPASADADASPDWELVTTERRFRWHDHRTHWMSPEPPPAVQDDPSRTHVVYERWEVPLTVDGSAAVVAGDLTWAPPPTLFPWVGLAVLIAAAAGALLWSRVWRTAAAGIAAIGTVALTVDTFGFVLELNDTLANRIWAFVYAIVAAAATARLTVHAARRTEQPTLAMMLAGLILTMMGAVDRFDVLTSGFYLSALPTWVARIATVTCLGAGIALIARFLWFLIPLLTSRTVPPAAHVATAASRPEGTL